MNLMQISKTPVGNDAERIAAARNKSIEHSKHFGRTHAFVRHPESYYQDFAGEQTSGWFFKHVTFLLGVLEHPKYQTLSCNTDNGSYDVRTATWTAGSPQVAEFVKLGMTVTLDELKSALADRIKELGVSEELLLEWNLAPRTDEESQTFGRLPFEQKLNAWRKVKS
jgi:hypothetical protein